MAILKRLLGKAKPAAKKESRSWPEEGRQGRAPVRVLLVDDDEEDYMLTRDVLADVAEQAFDLYWAESYEEAVSAIRGGNYDVYLLDYQLGSHTGIDLLRDELGSGTKGAAILLTGVRDRNVDMEAMRGGAAGYLVKSEAGPAEMERSIRYAIEGFKAKIAMVGNREDRASTRIISFLSVKGGSGSTTLAANVAVALAQMDRKAVALDLRPDFGTLAWQLGLECRTDIGNLLRMSPGSIDSGSVEELMLDHSSGLRVLASPQQIASYTNLDPDVALATVEATAESAEFLLVDLPSGFSSANREVLRRSDIVVLLMDREPSSLAAASKTVELLKDWEVGAILGVVIIDRIVLASAESATWMAASLDLELFRYIAAAKEVFHDASATQTPVVSSSPSHFAAQAFVELASKLASMGLKDSAQDTASDYH